MLVRSGVPLLVLLLFASASPMRSQQKPNPKPTSAPTTTISVTSRIVVLDVVVLDHDKPVCGLTQGDFQVLEDRKDQTLESFEPHCGEDPKDAPAQSLPVKSPLPPHTYDNQPATRLTDSVTVLLLDGVNTQAADNLYVRQQMIQYLRNLPPGRRIAVFALGSRLRLLQGFTTDSGQLLAAIASQKSTPVASRLLPEDTAVAEREQLDMLTQAGASQQMIMSVQSFMNESDTGETGVRVATTLEGMEELARYLSGIPGRKNVIWFSGSFPVQYSSIMTLPNKPDHTAVISHSFEDRFKTTIDLLTAAQVALYPVDARGVLLLPMFSAAQGTDYAKPMTGAKSLASDSMMADLERNEEHTTMDVLAEATGGRAFYDSNALKSAVTHALSDGSNFYTLSYSPKDKKDNGQWRKISVALGSRPGKGKYRLFYRRGYYAEKVAPPREGGEHTPQPMFKRAMTEGVPSSTQILFKVRVIAPDKGPLTGPIDGQNQKLQGRTARYAIDYAVSPQHIELASTANGGRQGSVIAEAVAFDDQGRAVNWISNIDPIVLSPADWRNFALNGLQIHQVLDLPKGSLQLRIGVYDPGSGRVGTLEVPLQVEPNMPARDAEPGPKIE